jgi:hypothetical protein
MHSRRLLQNQQLAAERNVTADFTKSFDASGKTGA